MDKQPQNKVVYVDVTGARAIAPCTIEMLLKGPEAEKVQAMLDNGERGPIPVSIGYAMSEGEKADLMRQLDERIAEFREYERKQAFLRDNLINRCQAIIRSYEHMEIDKEIAAIAFDALTSGRI